MRTKAVGLRGWALRAAAWALVSGIAHAEVLETFDAPSSWRAIHSDDVTARLATAEGLRDGAAHLQYDYNDTAGFAGLRRSQLIDWPDNFELTLQVRGQAPANHLDIKFADASGDNVWWVRKLSFAPTSEWQMLRFSKADMEFAWGPASDRTLRQTHSIELVFSAAEGGGEGFIEFDDLTLEARPPAAEQPWEISARVPGQRTTRGINAVLDDSLATAWTPDGKGQQAIELDLGGAHEIGGLVIDWIKGRHAADYDVAVSSDGREWRVTHEVRESDGERDHLYMPGTRTRWLRLQWTSDAAVSIAGLDARAIGANVTLTQFLQQVADGSPRGTWPRSFHDEQIYWTLVGAADSRDEGLLSEDGAFEAGKAGFSLEPMLVRDGRVLTWADAKISHSLAQHYLPIPSVQWRVAGLDMRVEAVAENGVAVVRYRLHNPGKSAADFRFGVAVRPLQVNPPQQFLNTPGGASPVYHLRADDALLVVNERERVRASERPAHLLLRSFHSGPPTDWLASAVRATSRTELRDDSRLASAAYVYDLQLAAGASRELSFVVTLDPAASLPASVDATAMRARVINGWQEKLGRVDFDVPRSARTWIDTVRTSLAHVLINRDGTAIHPGSRSYDRSWIRDGAMTSESLLRLGHEDVVREYLLWYAPRQFSSGKIPCCVDARGSDPVPENDSHGEFIFLANEYLRYTRDRQTARKVWPRVVAAVKYMDTLRTSERTGRNQIPERRALYGLMPPSISHEGYSAKPAYSYWDNFWALKGYDAAIAMADALGERAARERFAASRDEFRSDLLKSIELARKRHQISFIPGAADLGDFDATSTSIAFAPMAHAHLLNEKALGATFERYWSQQLGERKRSASWDVYTPYEWRNVSAFIHLGWRDRADELTRMLMADRRPADWNQWAEVIGRDMRKPVFIGDMPHGWVASDYIRSVLDRFAYEQHQDGSLMILAGVPAAWLEESFGIRDLRTPYGGLSYQWDAHTKGGTLSIEKLRLPPGGIRVRWPRPELPANTRLLEGEARWIGGHLHVTRVPMRVMMDF